MSAMLDTYDMQVLDYSQDHDIQMHPSSSDQWFQDEAKMEEDGPTLFKDESDLHMNPHRYVDEKANGTIEVDMEPVLDQQNTEYDMLDDDAIHTSEIVDVEVYDASHVQSPAMFAIDSVDGHFSMSHQAHIQELNSSLPETLSVESPNLLPALEFTGVQSTTPHINEENIVHEELAEVAHVGQSAEFRATLETETTVEFSESVPELANSDVDASPRTTSHEVVASSGTDLDDGHRSDASGALHLELQERNIEQPEQPHASDTDNLHVEGYAETDNEVQPDLAKKHVNTDVAAIHGDGASSGDPHEISEGVYIDPPPPVLLSMNSDDLFDFSLFNEPSTWNEITSKVAEEKQVAHVLLSSFPTLYYEPLSTVFDALRQEEYVQSLTTAAENELVVEAVDLQLVISEDNIYAREVTLHDLNVLHDISGIDGLLRMRLYTSAPRFITRYQYLQDEVSRLNLEAAADPNSETADGTLADAFAVQTDYENVLSNPLHREDDTSHKEENLPAETDLQTMSQDDGNASQLEQIEQDSTSASGHIHEGPFDELPVVEDPDTSEDAGAGDHRVASSEQDDLITSSSSYAAEPDENDDQGETTTYESTSSVLDNPSESGIIPLEEVEANLPDESSYNDLDPAQSISEEAGVDYEAVDEEEREQEESEENNSEVGQDEYQPNQQPNDQDEIEQAGENQQAALEPGPKENVEYHKDEYLGKADDPPISDEQHLHNTDPLKPSRDQESNYDQASVIDEATNLGENEGDNDGDATASYEESASTHTLDEFSHTEETGYLAEAPSDHALVQSDFFEETGETWAYELDEEEEDPTTWDDDAEAQKSKSNTNPAMLSTKASKRGFDEVDSEGEEHEHGLAKDWAPPDSPGPKRTRTQ